MDEAMRSKFCMHTNCVNLFYSDENLPLEGRCFGHVIHFEILGSTFYLQNGKDRNFIFLIW